MQWFRLSVENRRKVEKFRKALSFLAELREYHHNYLRAQNMVRVIEGKII